MPFCVCVMCVYISVCVCVSVWEWCVGVFLSFMLPRRHSIVFFGSLGSFLSVPFGSCVFVGSHPLPLSAQVVRPFTWKPSALRDRHVRRFVVVLRSLLLRRTKSQDLTPPPTKFFWGRVRRSPIGMKLQSSPCSAPVSQSLSNACLLPQ